MTITLYDTTLRDGSQMQGISFSVADKLAIAQKLADFGMQYIEGGWPGSNPKDVEFFQKAQAFPFFEEKITAFTSTRYKDTAVEQDQGLKKIS